MGSSVYAYFLPNDRGQLRPAAAVDVFMSCGFQVGSVGFEVLPDEEGHCEPRGKVYQLSPQWGHSFIPDAEASLHDLLGRGLDLEFSVGNDEIIFEIMLAAKAASPNVCLNWPLRRFQQLSSEKMDEYWRLLAEFGLELGVRCVVVLTDAPGYFEDEIAIVDGTAMVETRLKSGTVAAVSEIWTIGLDVQVSSANARCMGQIGQFCRHRIEFCDQGR